MAGFVDESQLNVRGGDGGAGAVSFRREGPVVRGGPNGGDGGRGGDVWLVADHNVASLLAFRDHPHRRAGDGAHGRGKDLHGKRGADLEVKVPVGTTASDLYTGVALADLAAPGDRWLAGRGGQGGRGNARFLTNTRRAPSFAEQGEHGQERWLKLELKLMADVALVGFPNAGKSTFISRISAARPKIADYPFTTLVPHLGVVRVDDTTEFVVADVPGLIEGASTGKGLGDRFLRHVERAAVMAVLVDLGPLAEHPPATQVEVLLRELGAYRPELLERPRLVVGTKADVAGDSEWDGPRMSAVTGQGVAATVHALAGLVAEARAAVPVDAGFVVHRPTPEGVRVERTEAGELRVVGRAAERAVALSDLTNPQALAYVDQRLKRLGVDRALARAGATPGDVVWVGAFSFTYEPDACEHASTDVGTLVVVPRQRGCQRSADLAVHARRDGAPVSTLVAKIGSSSVTSADGTIAVDALVKLVDEVVALRAEGHRAVIVTSGAVASGVAALGLPERPHDLATLQALSAAGQIRLMAIYQELLGRHGVVAAQVLLVPNDFVNRRQYLHARRTLTRLLDLGCVPVVNENDAIAPDEIRFGDNDRLAALVAHLVNADTLVLLTDTPGVHRADPRLDPQAPLVADVAADDPLLDIAAGGAGSARGRGGMASKLTAARIASWSGTAAVIAQAARPDVLAGALHGDAVGTRFHAHERRLPARKLWIAFASAVNGAVVVDEGAEQALIERGVSLLPAGVTHVRGDFEEGDTVNLEGPIGDPFARGMVAMDAETLRAVARMRTSQLPAHVPHEVVHRDDLVLIPRARAAP